MPADKQCWLCSCDIGGVHAEFTTVAPNGNTGTAYFCAPHWARFRDRLNKEFVALQGEIKAEKLCADAKASNG